MTGKRSASPRGFTLIELPVVNKRGFTLIELLVVIGIIAVLIAILIPVIILARRSATDVTCKSNIRQVCTALLNYAAENKGSFPPNIWRSAAEHDAEILSQFWFDLDRAGKYFPGSRVADASYVFPRRVLAPVLACPDDENASLSYAMNYFASCMVKTTHGRQAPPSFPRAGKNWGPHTREADKLILVVEMFSTHPDRDDRFICYCTVPSIGEVRDIEQERFFPGLAFIGTQYGISEQVAGFRHRPADTQIDWARHRRRGDGGVRYTENRGRANFGFADGHVASFTPDELANRTTTRSNYVALWSPLDSHVEGLPRAR